MHYESGKQKALCIVNNQFLTGAPISERCMQNGNQFRGEKFTKNSIEKRNTYSNEHKHRSKKRSVVACHKRTFKLGNINKTFDKRTITFDNISDIWCWCSIKNGKKEEYTFFIVELFYIVYAVYVIFFIQQKSTLHHFPKYLFIMLKTEKRKVPKFQSEIIHQCFSHGSYSKPLLQYRNQMSCKYRSVYAVLKNARQNF